MVTVMGTETRKELRGPSPGGEDRETVLTISLPPYKTKSLPSPEEFWAIKKD